MISCCILSCLRFSFILGVTLVVMATNREAPRSRRVPVSRLSAKGASSRPAPVRRTPHRSVWVSSQQSNDLVRTYVPIGISWQHQQEVDLSDEHDSRYEPSYDSLDDEEQYEMEDEEDERRRQRRRLNRNNPSRKGCKR